MSKQRVKFQLFEDWYEKSRFMAIKNGFIKKAGLMDWLLLWFLRNHSHYTVKRLPGAYENCKRSEKVMSIDIDKLAEITDISRKMGYVKPTDVLNWVFYNIHCIIEIQSQIEESKVKEGSR